ncbi:MAG: 3-isopropylmalate dehydratase small subunit [Crocinitomicaceae bacterium]
MEKIIQVVSSVVPILLDDIDTDQIIPARFLKATNREGFGDHLFRDWRYDKNNHPVKEFPLNDKKWTGEILLAGKNFGCGSSREHAAWALKDYGFKVVVSSYFADIFKGNALNNGIIPVEVTEGFIEEIKEEILIEPSAKLEVNLKTQELILRVSGKRERFEISVYKKECLINGLDDLDYLIQMKAEINEHINSIL